MAVRSQAGLIPYADSGVLAARLRPEGHRRPVRIPDHTAAGGAAGGSGRGCRGRVEHRHRNGHLDRPPHGHRDLPGQVLPGRARAGRSRAVDRADRLRPRPRPLRGGLDREPRERGRRQRLRVDDACGTCRGLTSPRTGPRPPGVMPSRPVGSIPGRCTTCCTTSVRASSCSRRRHHRAPDGHRRRRRGRPRRRRGDGQGAERGCRRPPRGGRRSSGGRPRTTARSRWRSQGGPRWRPTTSPPTIPTSRLPDFPTIPT